MAYDTRLRYDGVEGRLKVALLPGANGIEFEKVLQMDGGINVPTINSGEYLALSILDPNFVLKEIVYLTGYTAGDTVGFVDRGLEGTVPTTHPAGSKVVHAATVEDFLEIQEHNNDPDAHRSSITSIAATEATRVMTAHTSVGTNPNPHPQYLMASDVEFESGIVVPSGADLVIRDGGRIVVKSGGKIILEAGSEIRIDGRLYIHGKEVIISNTEPNAPLANTVWIKTFG